MCNSRIGTEPCRLKTRACQNKVQVDMTKVDCRPDGETTAQQTDDDQELMEEDNGNDDFTNLDVGGLTDPGHNTT